jgi:hypothetical protein
VEWFGSRRANIDELLRAHATIGSVGRGAGPGRPSAGGTEQLNEALVLRVTTEFQGFVRDLIDLATIKIVRGSGCGPAYQAQIIAAMTRNRMIDRGNPRLDAIEADLNRLGLRAIRQQLERNNVNYAADVARLQQLVELRNAVAHDDQDKLRSLSRSGTRATKLFVIGSRACLGRIAKALDRVVWDHLLASFSTDPWSP